MLVSFSVAVTTLFFAVYTEVEGVMTVVDARYSFASQVTSSTFSSTIESMSITDQYDVAYEVSSADVTTITRADNTVTFVSETSVLVSDYEAFSVAYASMAASSITTVSSKNMM